MSSFREVIISKPTNDHKYLLGTKSHCESLTIYVSLRFRDLNAKFKYRHESYVNWKSHSNIRVFLWFKKEFDFKSFHKF